MAITQEQYNMYARKIIAMIFLLAFFLFSTALFNINFIFWKRIFVQIHNFYIKRCEFFREDNIFFEQQRMATR